MSDFGRLVEQAKRELAASANVAPKLATDRDDARLQIAKFARDRAAFQSLLSRELQQLEANLESFDLRSDIPRTRLKRIVVAVFNRLLSVGGLARHLGSTQKRANEAVLAALRLILLHLEEQDHALAAVGEMAGAEAGDRSPNPQAGS